MKIINSLEEIVQPFEKAVVTIGNFDGVHKGHQVLFQTVKEKSRNLNGTSVGITFNPHPSRVLMKDSHPPLITMHSQKVELIEQLGIDALICIPFTNQFAEISAMTFLEDILVNRVGLKAIVVGKDYAFGKDRTGDIHFLNEHADRLGYEVLAVDWRIVSADPPIRISSTAIREIVMQGDMEGAKSLLGRHYQVRGQVVRGRNRGGRLLGFPTANIYLQDELCPKLGVYAVTVSSLGQTYQGVANIGYSPTFDDHIFTVEVHILDFDGNIYETPIRVNFIKRLRDEMKFANIDDLAYQIKQDIEAARSLLGERINF